MGSQAAAKATQPLRGPHARVTVEGAHPNAHLGVVVGVAAEQLRAALAAEGLLEAAVGVPPGLHQPAPSTTADPAPSTCAWAEVRYRCASDSGCNGSRSPRVRGSARRKRTPPQRPLPVSDGLAHPARLYLEGSGRPGSEAEHPAAGHRPATAPRHWPDEPGWLRELMPNDAELARTGLRFRQRLLQHGDVLAEPGDAVHRPLSRRARREATLTAADLRPIRATRRPSRDDGRPAAQRRGSRRRASSPVWPRRPAARRAAAARPSSTRARRPAAPPRGRRIHGRLQGQVAPHPSDARTARGCSAAGRPPTPSGSSATTGSPTGRRPTRARTPRRRTSAAATPARATAGTRSTPARSSAGWARRAPGAVLPGGLARQPPRRARLSRPYEPGGYRPGSSASSASGCRRRSTRTCAASPGCTR